MRAIGGWFWFGAVGGRCCGGLFLKSTNPTHEGSSSQRNHLLIPSHLGVRISMYEFAGRVDTNIQTVAVSLNVSYSACNKYNVVFDDFVLFCF